MPAGPSQLMASSMTREPEKVDSSARRSRALVVVMTTSGARRSVSPVFWYNTVARPMGWMSRMMSGTSRVTSNEPGGPSVTLKASSRVSALTPSVTRTS